MGKIKVYHFGEVWTAIFSFRWMNFRKFNKIKDSDPNVKVKIKRDKEKKEVPIRYLDGV